MMWEALRMATDEEMERDPTVLVMGAYCALADDVAPRRPRPSSACVLIRFRTAVRVETGPLVHRRWSTAQAAMTACLSHCKAFLPPRCLHGTCMCLAVCLHDDQGSQVSTGSADGVAVAVQTQQLV